MPLLILVAVISSELVLMRRRVAGPA